MASSTAGASSFNISDPGEPSGSNAASPRKSSHRDRSAQLLGLSLPNDELLVETGPPTDSLGMGSPAAREIRARPIDVDKEIPLLFVDDEAPGSSLTPSSSMHEIYNFPVSATRQPSAGSSGFAGLSSMSLASALATSPGGAFMTQSTLPADINIPQCYADPTWDAPLAARRFRLPQVFLSYKPMPGSERLVEYELDHEDVDWLHEFNQSARQILLSEDGLEEALDTLEKASFQALHASSLAARLHQPPAMMLSHGGYLSGHGGATPPGRAGSSREGGGSSRRESKRPSLSLPSPQRSPKMPKPPKPDRPPPPSDQELLHLPAGLCRRYQQGRCHKGRSCKWKHEMWPELQMRWEAWQHPPGAAIAPASAAASSSIPAAVPVAFPPPTTSGGPAQHHQLALDVLHSKEDDPLGALALSELGVTSALELVPPDLVPSAMVARAAAATAAALTNGLGGGANSGGGADSDGGAFSLPHDALDDPLNALLAQPSESDGDTLGAALGVDRRDTGDADDPSAAGDVLLLSSPGFCTNGVSATSISAPELAEAAAAAATATACAAAVAALAGVGIASACRSSAVKSEELAVESAAATPSPPAERVETAPASGGNGARTAAKLEGCAAASHTAASAAGASSPAALAGAEADALAAEGEDDATGSDGGAAEGQKRSERGGESTDVLGEEGGVGGSSSSALAVSQGGNASSSGLAESDDYGVPRSSLRDLLRGSSVGSISRVQVSATPHSGVCRQRSAILKPCHSPAGCRTYALAALPFQTGCFLHVRTRPLLRPLSHAPPSSRADCHL